MPYKKDAGNQQPENEADEENAVHLEYYKNPLPILGCNFYNNELIILISFGWGFGLWGFEVWETLFSISRSGTICYLSIGLPISQFGALGCTSSILFWGFFPSKFINLFSRYTVCLVSAFMAAIVHEVNPYIPNCFSQAYTMLCRCLIVHRSWILSPLMYCILKM